MTKKQSKCIPRRSKMSFRAAEQPQHEENWISKSTCHPMHCSLQNKCRFFIMSAFLLAFYVGLLFVYLFCWPFYFLAFLFVSLFICLPLICRPFICRPFYLSGFLSCRPFCRPFIYISACNSAF